MLVLLADVILSLRLRSASAEKALSCLAGQRLLARATDIRRPSGVKGRSPSQQAAGLFRDKSAGSAPVRSSLPDLR